MRVSAMRQLTTLILLLWLMTFGSVSAQDQSIHRPHPTIDELARQLEDTQQRLHATQRALQELRERQTTLAEPWSDPAVVPERTVSTSRYHEFEASDHSKSVATGDCVPEPTEECRGLARFCDACLGSLSWNKKGGWRIVPFGQVRGEAIYSKAPQTADAVILFLNPRQNIDEDQATVHGKTSQLNFRITGPTRNDWQFGGLIVINFLGPQPIRNQSGANIINAYGEVKNENWRFAFGRMFDLFGPITPNTVNGGQQRGAGNVGVYRGALNLDRYFTISDVQRWTLSARISQQNIVDYAVIPQIRGKDAGWPNIESRIGVELGPVRSFGRPIELGVSSVFGETQSIADPALLDDIILPAVDAVAQTRGVALDCQFKGERFGFRGEAWWGQAAGTYFVATLQSLNPETSQAIESFGGWGEVYYQINKCTRMHVGYGVDDPRNADLGFVSDLDVGQISYNEVGWCNVMWDVTEFFQLALELSYRSTEFIDPSAANEGGLVHFASTLKF